MDSMMVNNISPFGDTRADNMSQLIPPTFGGMLHKDMQNVGPLIGKEQMGVEKSSPSQELWSKHFKEYSASLNDIGAVCGDRRAMNPFMDKPHEFPHNRHVSALQFSCRFCTRIFQTNAYLPDAKSFACDDCLYRNKLTMKYRPLDLNQPMPSGSGNQGMLPMMRDPMLDNLTDPDPNKKVNDELFSSIKFGLSNIISDLQKNGQLFAGDKSFGNDCGFNSNNLLNFRKPKPIYAKEGMYACNICEFRCDDANSLKSHELAHTLEKYDPAIDFGDKPGEMKPMENMDMRLVPPKKKQTRASDKIFSCNQCEYTSNQLTNLKTHKLSHTGEKPFACTVCPYKTTTSNKLKIHNQTHTGEKPLACDLCSYRTNQLTNLKTHKLSHTGEKPFACTLCDYRVITSNKLKIHMQTHTGEKPLACNQCPYRTNQFTNLKNHKLSHTGERPYACAQCPYKGTTSSKLKAHMRTHTGEKPYACTMCTSVFHQLNHLKTHKLTHTKEKPYACLHCNYRSNQIANLKTHELTHTGQKPFACELCTYRGTTANKLSLHMNTHTDKRPFVCDQCDYASNQPTNLKTHKLSHNAEKAFKCQECTYKCHTSTQLKIHVRVHTGEKPFACTKCDYVASQRKTMRRHELTHKFQQILLEPCIKLEEG